MSSPTTTSPLGGPGDQPGGESTSQREIARFVAAVRAQLDDLSADEVAELTGGLEADLTDALAEEGDAATTPAQRYGDPAEYARELRAAAGLPPRSRSQRGPETRARRWHRFFFGPSLADLPPMHVFDDALREMRAQPWWPAVRDFVVVLRPAWWVLRAWVAVQLFWRAAGLNGDGRYGVVPGGVPGFLLLIVAVVISVELGRRSPLAENWQQAAITIANVIALIALLPVVSASGSQTYYTSDSYSQPSGLSLDGEPVTNVFPYDSQGRLLSGVQLYNQNGHPLEIGESARSYTDDATGVYSELVPGSGPGTPPRWNVFPMQARSEDETGNLGVAGPVPAPFTAVPALIAAPTPTSSSAPTSSSTPTSSATPTSRP